jgi:lipoprotein-anchoring transpeptidase ErfK/SrfK
VASKAGLSDGFPCGPARGREPVRGLTRSRRLTVVAGVPLLVVVLALSACTSKSAKLDKSPVAVQQPGSTAPASSSAPASSTSAASKAVITAAPAAGNAVSPIKPVTVSVTDGKLTSVRLLNPEGKSVKGALSADGTSWKNAEVLGYSKTYTLMAVAHSTTGKPVVKNATFTTLTPANMTMPYLQRPGGYSLDNGETYGVGIVPVVHFDEVVTDRKAAEKALSVTTSPHVNGVWNWVDDSNVHWRPYQFFKPGTKVTVAAKMYGVDVGQGLYGQADVSTSFKIGAKHVAVANNKTHRVKVYFSGKMVRNMPTSMGQGGTVTGKFGPISLWTMPGTYTVLAHENPAIMSSDSYGLPANSPLGYAPEKVYWATKISIDGIYLHQLDLTVWAQGNTNVSHGCLNLNLDNAKWYYQHAQVGDVVQVIHSGGDKIRLDQNGDWSVPWSTWVKGSALR